MPSVTVIRTNVNNAGAPVMAVHQEGGPVVSLISSPPQVRGTAAVPKITELERPGKHALTIPSAPGLRSMSFDHWIRHRNPYGNVEAEITALRAVAEAGARVRFTNGGVIPGDTWWWVEGFDIEEEDKGDGGVTSRAKLSWTLKQATTHPKVKLTVTKGSGTLEAPAQRAPGTSTGSAPVGYTGGVVRPNRGNITEF